MLRAHAATGDLKVFSPDELRSNRLGDLQGEAWAHEVLAEEVLLGWVAGWTATGRRGVTISYEAFAPLLLTGLVGQLKQRRLARRHDVAEHQLAVDLVWLAQRVQPRRPFTDHGAVRDGRPGRTRSHTRRLRPGCCRRSMRGIAVNGACQRHRRGQAHQRDPPPGDDR
ncbi:hypothetical protein HCB39_26690 [Salinispora arenicola]|nr:hypothetical protein [Salinispora arenicola]